MGKARGSENFTIVERPGGVRIVTVTAEDGRPGPRSQRPPLLLPPSATRFSVSRGEQHPPTSAVRWPHHHSPQRNRPLPLRRTRYPHRAHDDAIGLADDDAIALAFLAPLTA